MSRPSACNSCGTCDRCKRAAYMRDWYRRPGNAQAQRESANRSRQRRLEKVRAYDRARGHRSYDEAKEVARNALNKAVIRGDVERKPCEVCGDSKVDGHHDDYSKPLEVRWMCRPHHMELHRSVAA
jgi:hypothetical protein